jgi:chaperonin GroES
MKFRPLNDRVLLQRVDEDTKTTSGIIIPDTAQEKPSQGVIKAVGPGARNEAGERVPMSVAAGDKVMFGKWSGTEVNLDGTDYLIMGESDIMAVIEDAAPAKKSKSKKKAA